MLCVNNSALDVVQIGEMFQGTLRKTCLFAQLSDGSSVVMVEHPIAENGVRHLRVGEQVHLQQPGLQIALRFVIILQRFEQKGSALLDVACLHKTVDKLECRKDVNFTIQKQFALI